MTNVNYAKPLELLNNSNLVKVCAPMVRYSKLPFRTLVRLYDCDLAFTPMIVANSFNQSLKARYSEFSTNSSDRPLIAQFAANNASDFATAAEIIFPYSDGIDLNCGCPQKWAMAEGYGACMVNKPELLRDIIYQTRNRIPDSDFTVSVKIRIHDDIKKTVELCQIAEKVGLSFISVHGRTADQRKDPVNLLAIKLIRENVGIPVIANGDVKDIHSAKEIQEATGVHGVMAARGILENPAMYSGAKRTTADCVQKWLEIALSLGTSFTLFHHHLMFMLENILPKSERCIFNTLTSTTAVLDYLSAFEFEEVFIS